MWLARVWLAAGVVLALFGVVALVAPQAISAMPVLAADGWRVLALAGAALIAGVASRRDARSGARDWVHHGELVLFVAFLCFVIVFHSASTLSGLPPTHPSGERWWMGIAPLAPAVAVVVAALQLVLAGVARRRGSARR